MRLKDNANFLYSCSSYPTQSLKNLHRRKGGGYFGLCIKIYRALGELYAKQTFNRIAAKDYFKLNLANAAEIPNSVKLHHIAVWKTKWLDWKGAFLKALDEAMRRMDTLESRMPDQNVFVGIQSIILSKKIEWSGMVQHLTLF